MHTPPGELEVGERLSQEEIEEVFDTGFGYRISGINPRRADNDNRYILVFANEDGPYDDSVRQGRFEYVGEGLRGDQSEDSPGNSALTDAVSSDIPVYFFYKEVDSAEWEYQGQIDVVSYRHEEQGGRDVLIFTMEHEDQAEDSRTRAETNDELGWLTAMRLELERYRKQYEENTVTLHQLYDFSEARLSAQFPENDHVRAKIRQLLQRLRDRDEVEFLDDQGMYRIKEIQSDRSLSKADDEKGADPSTEEIEQEKTALEQAVDSEPELTEDETQYIETRRKARDCAFRELVRETYENTCAVCGSQRESPNGTPEVEAAHIYPKSEGGSDDVRNGIALCRIHHWAFDSGWLSFTDDHTIVVAEAPERNGYHEFMRLEGESLTLPDNEDAHPHPMFLEQHRELHGFEY